MLTAERVLNDALSLPRGDRIEVAREILLSLEVEGVDGSPDQEWAAEIRQRLARIRAGEADLREWSDVRDEIERTLLERTRS